LFAPTHLFDVCARGVSVVVDVCTAVAGPRAGGRGRGVTAVGRGQQSHLANNYSHTTQQLRSHRASNSWLWATPAQGPNAPNARLRFEDSVPEEHTHLFMYNPHSTHSDRAPESVSARNMHVAKNGGRANVSSRKALCPTTRCSLLDDLCFGGCVTERLHSS